MGDDTSASESESHNDDVRSKERSHGKSALLGAQRPWIKRLYVLTQSSKIGPKAFKEINTVKIATRTRGKKKAQRKRESE